MGGGGGKWKSGNTCLNKCMEKINRKSGMKEGEDNNLLGKRGKGKYGKKLMNK